MLSSLGKPLDDVLAGKSLNRSQAEAAMAQIIDQKASNEQIAAFLIALRLKEETVDEISGFLDCLKKRAIEFKVTRDDLMDVCGTGGDASGTFNISTTVTFVVAGAGQPIAKHGNRMVSSGSGSFDVLEVLGLSFDSDAERVARSIEDFGVGLLFAPAFHPSLKTLAAFRRSLGVQTVFNALGPLLNPARVKRQLIGAYSSKLLEKMANVLRDQGSEEVMVVRGVDGLDEISLSGPTDVAHLRNGAVKTYQIRPEDLGLKAASLESLRGSGPAENAKTLIDILKGTVGPKRDIVLLNSAAALMVGGKAPDLQQGLELARHSIDSGKALDVLKRMGGKV